MNSTKQLLNDYFEFIKKIANFEYTAIKFLSRSANNFYSFFINILLITIEKGNFNYKELEQIIILSKNLHGNIEEINNLELWSAKKLFKDQLDELNRFVSKIEFCLKNLRYISDALEDNSLSNSKKELIENYLFSKLVAVLQNKMNKENFEKIKLEIDKTNIENSSDKSILIAEFESNDKKKFSALSINNFVLKYKYRIHLNEEKSASLFQVTQNVIQYCQNSDSNERLEILKDLIFLIHLEYLSFEEIVLLLKMLLNIKYDQNKSIKLFLTKLAKNLSNKAENEITKKVNNAEFSQIFSDCIRNRLKKVSGQFDKKISVLVPFYEQVNKLLNQFLKEEKPEEENEFEKNAILAISYANCSDQVGIQNLNQKISKTEINLLKKICPKINENLNDFEIFEIFIFELVMIQLSLFSLSIEDKKKENKNLKSILQSFEQLESNNFQIRSIKAYLQSIDETVKKNAQIEKMLESLENVDKFVPYVKKILDKKDLKNDYLSELIDLSLKKKFLNDYDKQVYFLIECVKYSRLKQNETIQLFLNTVKLVNIDQLIYGEKIECILSLFNMIEECDKLSENLKILEKKIGSAFEEFCEDFEEKCKNIGTKSINTTIEQVIELAIDVSKNLPRRLNLSVPQLCSMYKMMVELKKFFNDFNYEIENLSLVNNMAESEKKLVNDFYEKN